jgi:RTX calcium-binding nonapeptide repeat (4 copies)
MTAKPKTTALGTACALLALACALVPAAAPARDARAGAAAVSAQEAAQLRRYDRGVYSAFCPAGEEIAKVSSLRAETARAAASAAGGASTAAATAPVAHVALASHAGWPAEECLKMDKGGDGAAHTLVGLEHVHNRLLGGYGNDTLYAGERGDVLWGDYQPSGQSEGERDYIHGGAGNDWIYSSHGFNEIWTGGGDDHLALVYGHGVIHCDGPGVKTFVMRYLPANRPWKLLGCSHKVLVRYRA